MSDATPPITAYLTRLDTAGLVELVQELDSKAQITHDDDGGLRLVARVPHPVGELVATVRYDPAYLDGAAGAEQRAGMQAYFRRFPCPPERVEAVVAATAVLTDAVTVLYEPDQLEDTDDPRDGLVWGLAQAFDGVIFLPGMLFDKEGRVLLAAHGDVDPAARLPADAHAASPTDGAEPAAAQGEQAVDDNEVPPPSADHVARRALVLAAVAGRSMLEQMHLSGDDMTAPLARLQAWAHALGIHTEAEDDEWAHVLTPAGALTSQELINGMWRLEGLGVLAWALGIFDLPTYDALVDPDTLLLGLGLMKVEASEAVLAEPTLRDDDELDAYLDQALAVHWRLREFSLRPEALDFADFAQHCWFGPFDASWASLAGGDLALEGAAMVDAGDELLARTHSSAMERHQAIQWLRGQRARYSEVDTST